MGPIFSFILAFVALFADEEASSRPPSPQKPSSKNSSKKENPHHIAVTGNYTYAWITPEGNSTTRGNLGGAGIIYEYRFPNYLYAAAETSWKIGKTENDNSSPYRTLQDFNTEFKLGYAAYNKSKKFASVAILYSGFGTRYMKERVVSSSASVHFNYLHLYIPVGFIIEQRYIPQFAIGIHFEWRPDVFPIAHISPLGGAWWSLKYHLDNYFVELPLCISLKSLPFNLIIAPFFELWHDGKSTAATTGSDSHALDLPGNRYFFAGANVRIDFVF